MAKQQAAQKYIFKISTSRLKKAKWNLTLPLQEARRNEEVISLNDSQMLRWIDELNGIGDAEREVRQIKREIGRLKKGEHSHSARAEIRRLYGRLDELQFKPDYLHLVIDRDKDLYRACKGFRVNGRKFVRLLGTNGGVKCSTIVFVNEQLAPELRKRIDNGRDCSIPQIPAKLEAYRALTCSGTIPVSMPKGILLVPDCETTFKEDIIHLTDEDCDEPDMQLIRDYEITLDESDGYGLMLPSLAERWSKELRLNYMTSGINCRMSWTKGMVFTFDFVDFAERVAGKYIVKDAWGNDVDIREVELVLTTSMLKLWKCYNSMEHYLKCCEENHYCFGIAKTCPRELESERDLNYQFIQSYNLDDEQVAELCRPTMENIRDILSGDYRKALLYLCGVGLDEKNVMSTAPNIAKAIMADPAMFDDPFIKRRIYQMIRKRIDDAKIGVLSVHGNYSIVCGDPYALAQSIFGLPVTGLLKAGEIYNRYWLDTGAESVACFRAPMTSMGNIRRMQIARGEVHEYWYRYMTTCTMLNAWDSLCSALNGADKDGDLIFLTDNQVLVDNVRHVPTVFCIQRSGTKIEVSEDDLVRANIASFGDDIGRITNYITSMFDVQSQFELGSKEHEILNYRITCGQLYQQNAIDKAKGIIAKPMPKSWYDRNAIRLSENPSEEDMALYELNMRIAADRKPYFMRYIYPALMRDYNTYIKNADGKCLRKFRMGTQELMNLPEDQLDDDQKEFLEFYEKRMPVGTHPCVMNRICWLFEDAFRGQPMVNQTGDAFNPDIMKSKAEYTEHQIRKMEQVFGNYLTHLKDIMRESRGARTDNDEFQEKSAALLEHFKQESAAACTNESALANIIIDLCSKQNSTKQLMWDLAGDAIVNNLLERSGGRISFPVRAEDGDIVYKGMRFKMQEMEVAHD